MLPLTVLVNGILMGGVYALASIGLALSWGTSRIINLAHGSFVILGAYIAWSLYQAGLHPAAAIPAAFAAGFALGFTLYYLLFHRVAENDVMSLLATFGVSLVLYALMLAVWGPDPRTIIWSKPPSIVYRAAGITLVVSLGKLYAFVASLVIAGVLYLLLTRTGMGRAMRALAQSFEAARIVGIDARRVGAVAFGLSLGLSMAAGVLITAYGSFDPTSGGIWLIVSFAVIALAGLRSIPGLVASGVILALAASLASFYWGAMYENIVPMIVLVAVFAVRPEGLFTRVRLRRV